MEGSNRVMRGGSWNNNARNCRSAQRNNNRPENRDNNVGFRLVFVPQLTEKSRMTAGEQIDVPLAEKATKNDTKNTVPVGRQDACFDGSVNSILNPDLKDYTNRPTQHGLALMFAMTTYPRLSAFFAEFAGKV
ncbi:SUMF1/EgtB/PvdO family nonheme iron enzyme [candidate division KSB1 bacterium]|nr:SUMF1/EgtB/PvdO family nonheme iron enzyme [candidate division KSB1 bacterium]